jgi:ABC-type uncharacterized transport system auxiliary subunit
MKCSLIFSTIICVGLILTNCAKKALIRKYYVLQTTNTLSQNESGTNNPLPLKVDIRDFQTAKAFDQTRIAVRTESHEMNYYFYHHWAVKPSITIADIIYSIVDGSGLFQRTYRGYSSDSNFIITGYIHEIERIDMKKHKAAHIRMSFELIDTETSSPVIRYELEKEVKFNKDKSMNRFANILSEILQTETEKFIHKIKAYFQDEINLQ